KTTAITELTEEVANLFPCPADALNWLKTIKQNKPRYIRDQLLLLKEVAQQIPEELCIKVLQYCLDNQITSAVDFKAIADHYLKSKPSETKIVHLNPLSRILSGDAYKQPDKSSIEDYQN